MPQVIIPDILPLTQAIAVGGQSVYSTNWTANAASDVVVYSRPTNTPADDATQVLAPNQYSVAFIGDGQIVQVTLVTPSTQYDVVTIIRQTPANRLNLYNNSNFTPSMLNQDFGILTLVDQQAQLIDDQTGVHYNYSDFIQPIIDNILPVLPAGMTWVKNSTNTAIITLSPVTLEQLASNTDPSGASLVGLLNQSNVNDKTVQDLANATFIAQTNNGTLQNGQFLANLANGILLNATGTGVLSISVPITSINNLITAADEMIYTTAPNVYAVTALTALARALLADSTQLQMQTTLGLVPGTDVQAWNQKLQNISDTTFAANNIILFTGANSLVALAFSPLAQTLAAETTSAAMLTTLNVTALAQALLLDTTTTQMQSTLGLVIGTNVQAWNAKLQSISDVTFAANQIAYFTAANTVAATNFTALAKTLLADTTQAQMNTTIGSLPISGGTMTGPLYASENPVMASEVATKAYVDSVAQELLPAAIVMTPSDMPTWTYNNGSSGAGATLTAPVNGATTFDGVTPSNGNVVLVNLQTTNPAWQGPYTIVQGTGGTPTVLTRSTDFDVAAQMVPGSGITVVQGTTYGATQWLFSQVNPITVGTTALTWEQLTGQGALLKANNLSDLPNAATARTNLGVAIGSNVEAWSALLDALAAVTPVNNDIVYTTGSTFAIRTLSAQIDAALGSTQGNILYRNSTVWTVLAPGTSGYLLQTGGAAANPSWVAPPVSAIVDYTTNFIFMGA